MCHKVEVISLDLKKKSKKEPPIVKPYSDDF